MPFSASFEFDSGDEIPLVLEAPANTFLAGYAIGLAHIEEEDGEPCITDITLGQSPAVKRFSWAMANESDRRCFEAMRAGLMACERFNDWLSDTYAFEPARRAA